MSKEIISHLYWQNEKGELFVKEDETIYELFLDSALGTFNGEECGFPEGAQFSETMPQILNGFMDIGTNGPPVYMELVKKPIQTALEQQTSSKKLKKAKTEHVKKEQVICIDEDEDTQLPDGVPSNFKESPPSLRRSTTGFFAENKEEEENKTISDMIKQEEEEIEL